MTEKYEKGSDCLTKSEGLEEFRFMLNLWYGNYEIFTSTGLRKLAVTSTGPADRTKVLWVEVYYEIKS